MRLNACLHLFCMKRLGYVVNAAHAESFYFVYGLIQRTQKNDRYIAQGFVFLEALTNFIAIHVRHRYIEKYEVRPFAV